jgi:hypothetical protein
MVRTKINSFVLIFELLAAGSLASHDRRECILLVGFYLFEFLYTIRNPNQFKMGTHQNSNHLLKTTFYRGISTKATEARSVIKLKL